MGSIRLRFAAALAAALASPACVAGSMGDADAATPGTDAFQPGPSDAGGGGGPATDAGGDPSGDDINAGFIGGGCGSDADCDYEGGTCLDDGDGFPGGMCTAPCALYCPDMAGAVTTFCI